MLGTVIVIPSRFRIPFVLGIASIPAAQLDARVVLLQNLVVRRAVERHPVGADLAHADAVAPAAAEEGHADYRAARVALDVVPEQAVAKPEQRAQAQCR